MTTNVSRKAITAIALFAGAAIALTGCSMGSGVPADQVVPSAGSASQATAASAPTASPAPIEDNTANGVVDGFAAWGIDRSAVDMSTASAKFGADVTENAVSTALALLNDGYSGDSLMVAHEQSLEDVAWTAMSAHATADFMAKREVVEQALIPTTSPEGTFTADGVSYDFASWTCSIGTVPTTAISANDEIELRAIVECAITTTQGTGFAYNTDVSVRMVPAGDTALVNSVGFTSTIEAM